MYKNKSITIDDQTKFMLSLYITYVFVVYTFSIDYLLKH